MQNNTLNSAKVHKDAFRELMKGVSTCVPGHVMALLEGGKNQRAQVQIGIQRIDVNGAIFNPPPIIDVPVCFIGDDYVVEYQIDAGCEGMIFFSQRCVDGWKNTGGIADNPIGRFHALQDAFFVPGFRSLGNVLPDFQNNGIRMRNKAGNRHMWIKNDGSMVVKNGNSVTTYGADNSVITTNGAGTFSLLANGNVVINGVIITPAGRITTPAGGGIIGSNGIPYETHKHGGVQTGGGTSGVPVA